MKLYTSPGRARLVCPRAVEGEPHLVAEFVWQRGSEHVEHHRAELTCECGELLVHASGPDPWKHPYIEVEGRPHGA